MSEYGLTEAGFRLKRLRNILDDMKKNMSSVKDPDSNETLNINWDENDPFIQFMQITCDELSAIWQQLNNAYDQFNPLNATGTVLSSLVQLNGIQRKKGSPSTVAVRFSGNPGFVVPAYTVVSDEEEKVLWQTVTDSTVTSDGTVTTECRSKENGAFTAPPGTITKIVTEIVGIESAVNLTASTPGNIDESDSELRKRRFMSTEIPSRGLAESIHSGVSSIEGVQYCKIYTNRTMETDANGIPRKSVAIVVLVEDEESKELKEKIGKEIFLRAGLGEEFYSPGEAGDGEFQEVQIKDSFQQMTQIRFIYPKKIKVNLKITVSGIEGSEFPPDYENRIKENILNFARDGIYGIGIQPNDRNNFDDFGFPVSEDVVLSRLYTPINAVPGVKVVSILASAEGQELAVNDIPIPWDGIAQFDYSRIEVVKA